MSSPTAIVGLALATLSLLPGTAPAFEGDRLLRCQRDLVQASAQFLTVRRQALERCVAKALRCRDALAGGTTAADDPCLAAVARRCGAQLAAAANAQLRLERVVPHCAGPRRPRAGVSLEGLFGEDGLFLEGLPAFCRQMRVRPGDLTDASHCQSIALACSADLAVTAAAPRAPEWLARLGMPLGADGCVLSPTLCGNGELDGDEECDDGAANSDSEPDACRTTCLLPTCGDGTVDSDEECDDGNAIDGDGCESDCTVTLFDPVCGNGVVEDDEECDDGNAVDGDGCESDCTITLPDPVCGNGIVEDDEECDDGTANSDSEPDACRTTCLLPTCGDGTVDSDEECDDGNAVDGDGCESDCTITFFDPVCGNGIVEDGEECDDGNTVDRDGCESDCTLTQGPYCGNGIRDQGEQCDDGPNNSDTLPDHCRTNCRKPSCGDGVVDVRAGEQCEPRGTPLCDNHCHLRAHLVAPEPLAALQAATPASATVAEAPARSPQDLGPCQEAILQGGAQLFERTRRDLGDCVAAIARCRLAIPEERDPTGRRTDACFAGARRSCVAVISMREGLRAAAVRHAAARCRAAEPDGAALAERLLDASAGLGFQDEVVACPGHGAKPADLLECAFHNVQCSADKAIARTMPRAYDLLSELDPDVDEVLPCVTDPRLGLE